MAPEESLKIRSTPSATFDSLRDYVAALKARGLLLRFRGVDQDAYEATGIMYALIEEHGLLEPPARTAAVDLREPGEDDSLIRWMLSFSPAERLQVLQAFVDSVSELRRDQPTAIQRRP